MVMRKDVRTCNACGKEMDEGYCIEGGMEYYCSDACLHTEVTPEEWAELYDDGEGDSYWTDWSEDPESDWYDDGEPAPEVTDPAVREYVQMLERRIKDYGKEVETMQSLIDFLEAANRGSQKRAARAEMKNRK